jgi:RHS repeat-associated protein
MPSIDCYPLPSAAAIRWAIATIATAIGGGSSTDVNRGLPVLLKDSTRLYVWGVGLAYAVDSSGNIEVHHADGLGSVRALTNGSANVETTYLTDPFGFSRLVRPTGPGQRMQYTGEVRDSESGFMYLRARMYDPGVGRFLQRDQYKGSQRSPMTLNGFAYAGQNPISFVDPTGLSRSSVLGTKLLWQAPPDVIQCAPAPADDHPGRLINIGCSLINTIAQAGISVGGSGPTPLVPVHFPIKPPSDESMEADDEYDQYVKSNRDRKTDKRPPLQPHDRHAAEQRIIRELEKGMNERQAEEFSKQLHQLKSSGGLGGNETLSEARLKQLAEDVMRLYR